MNPFTEKIDAERRKLRGPPWFDGGKLRTLRLRFGLSYADLAELLKPEMPRVSKQDVWNWERGINAPRSANCAALCAAFKKPWDYFFGKK